MEIRIIEVLLYIVNPLLVAKVIQIILFQGLIFLWFHCYHE